MEMKILLGKLTEYEVTHLKAECGVRYWEDATVNGVEDEDGTLIPFRVGDTWCPKIDLSTGIIENWPEGVSASVHYKVCDDGRYELLDASGKVVRDIMGYVPSLMSPGDNGYGDYVIMKIDGSGKIDGWKADLTAFAA
jgi:hypothetical protein